MSKALALLFCIGFLTLPAHSEPHVVGALAELSGPFARLGEDCRLGYQVAIAQTTGAPRVIIADSQNDPKVGISEFRRMVDSEHATVIVTSRSPVGLALNPLSAQRKIPLIGVVGHPRFVKENPYAVRIFPSARDEAYALTQVIQRNNEPALGVVTVEDDYFLGVTEALRANLGRKSIALDETVSPNETDFSSLMTRLRSAGVSGVFANVAPAQAVSFVKKAKESRLEVRLYGNFTVGSADIRKALGEAGTGLIFAELNYHRPGFMSALKTHTGASDSSPIGYGCYVALTYAFQMLDQRPAGSPSEDWIALEAVQTVDGPIRLSAREAKFPVVLKKLVDGQAEPFISP